MWQFLQTYGPWMLFGLVFLLMMRMHSGGMHGYGGGHGMGHYQDEEPSAPYRADSAYDQQAERQRVVPLDDAQRTTRVRDFDRSEEQSPAEYPRSRRHSGC